MDLKQRSGLSYPYIAEIENGSKKSPSLKAVAAIAEALGVSSAELQARAEELKSAESERKNLAAEIRPPEYSATGELLSASVSSEQNGQQKDGLAERITARVLEAVGLQLRDLVAREVRYAVREELLGAILVAIQRQARRVSAARFPMRDSSGAGLRAVIADQESRQAAASRQRVTHALTVTAPIKVVERGELRSRRRHGEW
jgi:transcriptional regulator with XRE-family HTH domain